MSYDISIPCVKCGHNVLKQDNFFHGYDDVFKALYLPILADFDGLSAIVVFWLIEAALENHLPNAIIENNFEVNHLFTAVEFLRKVLEAAKISPESTISVSC